MLPPLVAYRRGIVRVFNPLAAVGAPEPARGAGHRRARRGRGVTGQMWRRPALLGALQRLPVFCRWKSKYGGTQYKRNLINRRKPKPSPPRVFAPADPEHKERKMSMFGANLYELLSRMPNYGIGYRVYRDSWKLKG